MGKKNELVKAGEQQLPATVNAMLEQYAGAGQEDFAAGDLQLPFLYLLQDMSPQVKSRDPKYIEGARAGDFLHSVLQAPIDGKEGVRVIPIGYNRVWNEWVPREEGGGFVASHDTKDEAFANRIGGNDVVETANWFLLAEIDGAWAPLVLSCTSTKLKASRNLASRINLFKVDVAGESRRVPIFMQLYVLKSVQQRNRHGDFFTISFTPLGIVEDEALAKEGAVLREMFEKRQLGLDFNKQNEGTASESKDEGDDDGEY